MTKNRVKFPLLAGSAILPYSPSNVWHYIKPPSRKSNRMCPLHMGYQLVLFNHKKKRGNRKERCLYHQKGPGTPRLICNSHGINHVEDQAEIRRLAHHGRRLPPSIEFLPLLLPLAYPLPVPLGPGAASRLSIISGSPSMAPTRSSQYAGGLGGTSW